MASNCRLLHFITDCVSAIASERVNTGANEKVGAHLLGQTEEFVNIALAISDVHGTIRIVQQCGGLLNVLQPANALFLFDRHTSRIDPVLQSVSSMKFISISELNCGQTEWQAFARGHETGVHQDPAGRVIFTGVAYRSFLEDTYRTNVFTREGEFCRVAKNENRKPTRC